MKTEKKHMIIVTLSVIIVAVIIPVLLQKVLSLELSGSEGSGFWGSYLGGIIGALTSLCIVSIQINKEKKNRQEDEIIRMRPYLIFRIVEIKDEVTVNGTIHNVGLNTACDIWIKKIDYDHPDDLGWSPLNDSIGAGDSIPISFACNLAQTLMYEFTFKDLLNNEYRQEFRYDTQKMKFYSLAPKLKDNK